MTILLAWAWARTTTRMIKSWRMAILLAWAWARIIFNLQLQLRLRLRLRLFFSFLTSNFLTTWLLIVPLHRAHDNFVILDCLYFGGFVTSLELCYNILQTNNIELFLSQLKFARAFDVIIDWCICFVEKMIFLTVQVFLDLPFFCTVQLLRHCGGFLLCLRELSLLVWQFFLWPFLYLFQLISNVIKCYFSALPLIEKGILGVVVQRHFLVLRWTSFSRGLWSIVAIVRFRLGHVSCIFAALHSSWIVRGNCSRRRR